MTITIEMKQAIEKAAKDPVRVEDPGTQSSSSATMCTASCSHQPQSTIRNARFMSLWSAVLNNEDPRPPAGR
jgi:hypothetical protein